MPRRTVTESRIPWHPGRLWRPGEVMRVSEGELVGTFRLRSVVQDHDPSSEFATVLLEPIEEIDTGELDGEVASAAS